jgi:glyoxylase-like metal-dependent hydrolase (beta-lactamase superfamily II)
MQTLKKKYFDSVEIFKFGYAPIGKPLMTVCNYWLDGLMIDTAQINARRTVLKAFQDKKISQIALTHWHEDHIGNTDIFYQKYKPILYAHPFTAQKVQEGFKVLPYEQYMFGRIQPSSIPFQDFPEKIETDRYTLLPIHTPGHSIDHTVFLEPQQGWLFAGDLFVSTKIKYFRQGEDLGEQIESIKKVLQYDFEVIFCGHYPQFKNGKELFRQKLQYFQDFYGQVSHLYHQGKSLKEIMKVLALKEAYWLKWATFGDVSVAHMVNSVIIREKNLKMV